MAGAAAATIRQFSYDPANEQTRVAAGAVTFVVNQKLLSTRVLKMRATDGQATAELRKTDSSVFSRIGAAANERDVYEVLTAEDGPALIAAFCPGSRRAWMAFSPVKLNEDLSVLVAGDDPKGGPPRRCRALDFTFHGEWRAPPGSERRLGPVGPPHFPK
jgi:hypothetical protein